MNYKVFVPPLKDQHDRVTNALIAHNETIVGSNRRQDLTIHVENDQGELVGGANGYVHFNYFFLSHLWLSEKLRGQGIGAKLLAGVEHEAAQRGCHYCWLDTFSFQAPGFYQKYGYEKFGELPDYPEGHKRYFYFKRLTAKP